jgi:four helix bundle protein
VACLSSHIEALTELVTQLTIANRQGFIDPEGYSDTYEQAEVIARMLSGLKSSLLTANKPSTHS